MGVCVVCVCVCGVCVVCVWCVCVFCPINRVSSLISFIIILYKMVVHLKPVNVCKITAVVFARYKCTMFKAYKIALMFMVTPQYLGCITSNLVTRFFGFWMINMVWSLQVWPYLMAISTLLVAGRGQLDWTVSSATVHTPTHGHLCHP